MISGSPEGSVLHLADRETRESGFTLVEMVLALSILAGVLVATASLLTSALTATLLGRQNQGAGDVLGEQVERARSGSYAGLAMVPGDLAGDSAVTLSAGQYWYDPGGGPELVVTAPTGSVNPHVATVSRSNTVYTVRSYVTAPVDATPGSYKRLIVQVSWLRGGRTHERKVTTFVTYTRRGLPTPRFTFGAPVTAQTTPGGTVSLPFSVTNRGARDAWNLTITHAPADRAWAWVLYRDDNGNGLKDDIENVTLADTNGDGIGDTGPIDPDKSLAFVAVRSLAASEPLGQVEVKVAARSIAQPDASTGSAAVTDRVEVQAVGCGACSTGSVWYLHNTPSPPSGNTVSQDPMPMNATAPTGPILYNYDTEADAAPGRLLAMGGTTASTPDKRLTWRGTVGANLTVGTGSVTVRFYAAMKDNQASKKGQLRAYVRSQDAAGVWVDRGGFNEASPAVAPASPVPKWGVSGYKEVVIEVPVSSFTMTAGGQLELTIVATSNSNDAMWAAFDTTAHSAKASFPVVA